MSEYKSSMKNYPLEAITITGPTTQEQTVTIIDSLPEQTAVSDDQSLKTKDPIPKYMAPKTIEVKRYILKK